MLKILGALLDIIKIFVLSWWQKRQDPRVKIEEQKKKNEEAIANGTAGELLEHRINRLRALSKEGDSD